ncbi:hypothetical protein H112_03202 [Trichophyton rubrum D6]|uniref:Shelterin complex subunit TPP1/Est3 domain-containing protein n=3 Tax=Trichophyton TaxID=5550 RepID=F2STL6_TRIRC|nr:uncharacterized protein TERG_05814 [Trichophyton rubrum CBS 118892]EZF24340.1 hypothetical protein H100_03206 [Trichophyton rubrum MR850]EZF43301.1 hypothetical protein H102_03200 [Trichophyton rubrum CBS 100081]EZF53943.1 hypothetical protein H103_03214 [Trichophyton rubrum CBS 288.86]EZF64591.1 hypothetical protein H104_03196 [Trichophyton rubrum CBS 289.86]EZF85870.1 hypothetical protein H110_03207 [Trichophyton rubrum MR1448]EZF96651.1 hypothetical protein H113_03215 [Trichophyton rubr
MELLKKWIEPLVATAISQSVDKDDPNLKPKELKTTVDDGNNFRIPVMRPKYAQLLEWLLGAPTPQAILSDSHTFIPARFSERVCQNFNWNNSDIRSNVTPCLLRIKQCEIIIAKSNRFPPQISLYISEIKLEGCEKEGVFGNPGDIAQCKAVLELKDKWFRKIHILGPTVPSPRNDESGHLISQVDATTPNNGGNPEPRDHHDNSARESGWHTQAHVCIVAQTPKAQENKGTMAVTLLNNQGLQENSPPKSTISKIKPRCSPTLEHSTKNDDKQAGQTTQLSATTDSSSVSSSPRRQSCPNSIGKATWKAHPIPSQPDQHEVISSLEERTTSATYPRHSSRSRHPDNLSQPSDSKITKQVSNRGFFSGWNKIRRRDVVIPESQLNLIESDDSWIPPDPGKKTPQNFFPLELLQEWSESHKAKATASIGTSRQRSPGLGEGASSIGSPAPDDEIGSEDWPPTSPVPLVPLDSSPPGRNVNSSATPSNKRTSAANPTNATDAPNRPPPTKVPGFATKDEEVFDGESCPDFEIELSIPRDLYTSTQNCDILAGMDDNEDITGLSETMLSQQLKAQPAPSCESTKHDFIAQNSRTNNDQMVVTSQISGEWSGGSGNLNDSATILQVPRSSLENADHNVLVLPPTKTSASIPLLDNTNQQHKRKAGSPSLPSSPRKAPRITEVDRSVSAVVPSHRGSRTFDKAQFSSQTEEIYYKFQQAYKTYTGSLEVFTRACCRLQFLRKSLLKKSIMWDDFVAREVLEYQDYLQRCDQRHKKPNTYEDYFEKHAKFPLYKRRNLTVKNLQAVVTEAEGESDCASELGDGAQKEATPEVKCATLQLAIPESPCKHVIQDWESEGSDSETPKVNFEASWHDRASVELGDEPYCRISVNKSRKRKATPFEEDEAEESEDEDVFHSARGGLHQPIRLSHKLDKDGVFTNNTYQMSSRPSSLLAKGPTASHPKPNEPNLPSKAKLSRAKRSPAPSLPSHRHTSSTKKTRSAAIPGRSTSWKDPNTSLKVFLRDYVRIPGELGTLDAGLNSGDVPVDEAGVVQIKPRKPLQVGGRMNSMGLTF